VENSNLTSILTIGVLQIINFSLRVWNEGKLFYLGKLWIDEYGEREGTMAIEVFSSFNAIMLVTGKSK